MSDLVTALAKVLGAVLTPVVGPLVSFVNRQEVVVRVRRDLGLTPDHPSADFRSVYVHAFVEYADGRAVAAARLFQDPEVIENFPKVL